MSAFVSGWRDGWRAYHPALDSILEAMSEKEAGFTQLAAAAHAFQIEEKSQGLLYGPSFLPGSHEAVLAWKSAP